MIGQKNGTFTSLPLSLCPLNLVHDFFFPPELETTRSVVVSFFSILVCVLFFRPDLLLLDGEMFSNNNLHEYVEGKVKRHH